MWRLTLLKAELPSVVLLVIFRFSSLHWNSNFIIVPSFFKKKDENKLKVNKLLINCLQNIHESVMFILV